MRRFVAVAVVLVAVACTGSHKAATAPDSAVAAAIRGRLAEQSVNGADLPGVELEARAAAICAAITPEQTMTQAEDSGQAVGRSFEIDGYGDRAVWIGAAVSFLCPEYLPNAFAGKNG